MLDDDFWGADISVLQIRQFDFPLLSISPTAKVVQVDVLDLGSTDVVRRGFRRVSLSSRKFIRT